MFDGFFVFAGCIVNGLLAFRHAVGVFLQGAEFAFLTGHEQQKICQLVLFAVRIVHAVIYAGL